MARYRTSYQRRPIDPTVKELMGTARAHPESAETIPSLLERIFSPVVEQVGKENPTRSYALDEIEGILPEGFSDYLRREYLVLPNGQDENGQRREYVQEQTLLRHLCLKGEKDHQDYVNLVIRNCMDHAAPKK